MTLTAPTYVVTLSRVNGALLSIADGHGVVVSGGSNGGCLWGAWSSATSAYVGGCSYSGASHFSYGWAPAAGVLTLTYTPAGVPTLLGAVVTLATGGRGSDYFDLTLTLTAPPAAGAAVVYDNLAWPSELLFNGSALSALYLPILPGVALGTSYFAAPPASSFTFTYPGQGGFAAWVQWAVAGANASLAVYDLSGPTTIVPYYWGMVRRSSPVPAGSWYWFQTAPVNITAGCVCGGGGGGGPCNVGTAGCNLTRRFVVSADDPLASIARYAADNGMGAYPSLAAKVGPGLLQQTAAAPLVKFDASVSATPFVNYTTSVYPGYPIPALVHYVAFEVGGFDRNYPDYLPPAPALRSTSCDVANAMAAANAGGRLSMAYENPTWWDPASPTLVNVSDLHPWAVWNATGGVVWETYDVIPRTGIAVSPHAPPVLNRTAALLRQFSLNVTGESLPPGTPYVCSASDVRLPMTYVFEDQIGARWPYPDYNPAAGGSGCGGYAAAFQAHVATYASVGLHTEQGVDRLAAWVVGFHGSVLGYQAAGNTAAWWGDANWWPLPLYGAGWRAATIHYQHNLDPAAMAGNLPNLCWSLAAGMQLSMDTSALPYNASWLRVVGDFSAVVVSRYLTAPAVAAGTGAVPGTYVTSWAAAPPAPTYTVTRNVAAPPAAVTINMPLGGNATSTLPPASCLAAASDGSLLAGLYTAQYNGASLTPGAPHAILEDRACDRVPGGGVASVCVYHPWGPDTPLAVVLPPSWGVPCASCVNVTAWGAAWLPVATTLPVTITTSTGVTTATFTWAAVPPGALAPALVYTLQPLV